MVYNHKEIERKWQEKWEKDGIYRAEDKSSKPASAPQDAELRRGKDNFYCLIEFPYPSGEGLHVGHPRSYTAMDIIARKKRMEGKNVLYPIGWDAFGLPTENYAIKTGVHPKIATEKNIKNFMRQLKSLGFSFDWSREINTTDPEYYKWTQWMFLQFFKHGLAYKTKMAINWCLKCKIGLANEEVVNGKCERCGGEVEKRQKEQWMIKITKYAQRLIDDLDKVDYLPRIKDQQINWIGRSEGAEVDFKIKTGEINLGEKHSSKKIEKMFEILDEVNEAISKEKIKIWFNGTFGVAGYYGHVFDDPHDVDCGVLEKDLDKAREIIEKLGYKKIEDKENPKFKVSVYDAGDFTLEIGTFDRDLGDKIVKLEGREFRVPEADWFAECYRITAPKERRAGKNDALRAEFLESISENLKIKVFTTCPDTLFGATYMVLAPEHEIIQKLKSKIQNLAEVEKYIEKSKRKSDLERTELQKEKTGVELEGIKAINPVNNEEIPVWVADYVLTGYGTGAIMAVPAHDERDFEFAKKFNLQIKKVVQPPQVIPNSPFQAGASSGAIGNLQGDIESECFSGYGMSINSDFLSGLLTLDAKEKMTEWLEKNNVGKKTVNYKLRDWVFSRQRYWGEPIPLVFCPACAKASAGEENAGWLPIREEDLPVELPEVEKYEPTDNGESPLANMHDWINVKCPKCGGEAKRETDTMPNWAGSSWYFLRYTDPKNKKEFASAEALKNFMPVDWYNGGMEHVTLHLLYSRFWHKFLYDIGVIPKECGDEPYKKRTSHGMILGEGGEKMSKSRGNVINPDEMVKLYGADTLRVYEMFMGPFDQAIPWDTKGLVGCRRFLEKVWGLKEKIIVKKEGETKENLDEWQNSMAVKYGSNEEMERRQNIKKIQEIKEAKKLLHQTVKKVGEDIEGIKFNTAIAQMMIFINGGFPLVDELKIKYPELELGDNEIKQILKEDFEIFLKLLAPFAPHIAEELWSKIGNKTSIHLEKWPEYDKSLIVDEEIELIVQINGKLRDKIKIKADLGEEEAKKIVLESEKVKIWIDGKKIKQVVFVKGKLMNIVV